MPDNETTTLPAEFTFGPVHYTPWMFHANSREEMKENMFKGGDLPKVGDVVELVVYEVVDKDGLFQIAAKWQIKR